MKTQRDGARTAQLPPRQKSVCAAYIKDSTASAANARMVLACPSSPKAAPIVNVT